MNYKILIITLLTSTFLFSQEIEKDSIGTEEVNIIKPYAPKIKDAFKVKKNPTQGKDSIQAKKPVEYSINSAPVASTFVAQKGKAKGVAQKEKERIYENYASVGFGNFTTPKIEAFVHTSTTRDNDFGALLNFLSSNGGVEDVKLDNNFMDAKIDLFYKQTSRDFDWKINGGYHYQKYNWYGIVDPDIISDVQMDNINPNQNYGNINFGGEIIYYENFFKSANIDINVFSDKYSSSELHFLAQPTFEIPVSSELIKTDFRLEYISGKFDRNYFSEDELKYGFYNLGISPTFKVVRDYLTLNLGAKLVYTGATEGDSKSKFLIYPNITASYELITDVMILYVEVTGDLEQHSYRKFVAINPFVSPTLNIGRTNKQYDAKFGAKGKLASNISYNVNASYKSEEAKALYKLNNVYNELNTNENYQFGNSFSVVYDDINTLGVFGEINIDFSKELSFGGNVQFSTYDKDLQEKAWNLPSIEASVFANYTTQKWNAGANLFFVGERKDEYNSNGFILPLSTTQITNKSYIDLNLNFTYNFTDRLSGFANANNVLGADYHKYTGFEVQGLQFLAGVKYKFDL